MQLITTDGHRGLHAALDLVYSVIPRQACWVHVLRNVANRLRVKDREACLRMARRIYQAPTTHAARRLLRQWVQAWQATAPAAVACLTREEDALLSFYPSPRRTGAGSAPQMRLNACFAKSAGARAPYVLHERSQL